MKQALVSILKIIGAIALIILAIALFLLIIPLAFIWKAVVSISNENRKARDIMSGMAVFFTEIAASFDQLGNAVFGGFLNWLFIKGDGYAFGDKDDTVSEALGWNERYETLSKTGTAIVWILHKLEKDHCRLAMLNGVAKAEIKVLLYKGIG